MKITYRKENGCFYSNLELPEQSNYTIGKYGLLHLDFIKEHRKGRYTLLVSECRLNEYLHLKQMFTAFFSLSLGESDIICSNDIFHT